MDKNLLLYGAGGHAKVIVEIAEANAFTVEGVIDTNPEVKDLLGYPVYQDINDVSVGKNCEFIISIGNNRARRKVSRELNAKYATLMHPSANLSKRIEINPGTAIMAGVSVNSSVRIGGHVILNTNCSIDHDCVIGDFVHVSPNAALAGGVTVGEGSHIGIGACVIQGVKIGKWCTVGAGAVIIRDVPDYSIFVGNPGRVIKTNYKL